MFSLENRVKGIFRSGLGRTLLLSTTVIILYACGGSAIGNPISTPPPENTRPVATATTRHYEQESTTAQHNPITTPNQNYASSTQNPGSNESLEDNVATTTKATTTIEPVVVKPFEFVCEGCTDEQYKTFSKNAEKDYEAVLEYYPMEKQNARMVVGVGDKGYGANFYFEGRRGVGVGLGVDDFVNDRREVRHEMAEAINETIFPTEDPDEPWYNTWDEGMAKYAELALIT